MAPYYMLSTFPIFCFFQTPPCDVTYFVISKIIISGLNSKIILTKFLYIQAGDFTSKSLFKNEKKMFGDTFTTPGPNPPTWDHVLF